MAATSCLFVVARFSQPAARLNPPPSERKEASSALSTRRQCLLMLAATATASKAAEMPAGAKDIPLFGLKPGLQAAEKEAELLVKEGFEAAEKGVEFAEKEIESAVSFGNLNQAGAVAAAELAGIVIATSVVNGILGTEAQNS